MSSFSATDAARRVRYRRRQEEKRQHEQQEPLLRSSAASGMSATNLMTSSILSPPTSPTHQRQSLWRGGQQQNQQLQQQIHRRNRLPTIVSPTSPSRSWDEGDARPPSPGGGNKGWHSRNITSSTTIDPQSKGNPATSHISQGSIFRRVKSSPGVVETADSNAEEEDVLLADNESVASSRRSSSGDGLDEMIMDSSTHTTHKKTSSPASWDARFAQVQERALLQQRDNSRSLIAIQQLLANVQAERDQALSNLDVLRQQLADSPLQEQHGGSASPTSSVLMNTGSTATNDSKIKALIERTTALENELRKVAPDSSLLLVPQQQQQHETTQEEEWKNKEIVGISEEERVVRPSGSCECDSIETSPSLVSTTNSSHVQFDTLRKELHDKTSALENAKMIIASLEKSCGTLAADHKTKILRKDQEIARLKSDNAEHKKKLDALAIELRDVQRQPYGSVPTQAESIKRIQLASRLEANLADIRSAAVILESTQDPAAVISLSDLLQDSANTLRDGIAAIENGVAEDPHGRSFNLWRELEEKKKAIRNLEQSLSRQEDNFRHLRREREATQTNLENEILQLQTEVRSLRQQCITNMEVLTKKERELVVLRDSLKVEDDVGYISDDEEEETEDNGQMSATTPAADTTKMMLKEYGHSQTEALATLLAAGGNHSFDSGVAGGGAAALNAEQISRQLAALKSELSKSRTENEKTKRQLQVEKESLCNAKLIISSLERANKKMMEDLRARLQDSNSAIDSLLEKSRESEKTNSKLRSEIEGLKRNRRIATVPAIAYDEEPLLAIPPAPAIMELAETID